MAVRKNSTKKQEPESQATSATMGEISYEVVMLAHKFTCPYYSIRQMVKLVNTDSERVPTQSDQGHCGAQPVWEQKPGQEAQCTGNCWYMNHFRELIKGLQE